MAKVTVINNLTVIDVPKDAETPDVSTNGSSAYVFRLPIDIMANRSVNVGEDLRVHFPCTLVIENGNVAGSIIFTRESGDLIVGPNFKFGGCINCKSVTRLTDVSQYFKDK